MKTIPELLIVAGTGRNSGKTTLVCKLITRFRELDIISVKISPHIHDQTDGSKPLHSETGYSIFREFSTLGNKDTAKMLIAGANQSFYIHASDQSAEKAFNWFLGNIVNGGPVICESPVLRRFFHPGLFLIADSDMVTKRKDLSPIVLSSDMVVRIESDHSQIESILFGDGRWFISG